MGYCPLFLKVQAFNNHILPQNLFCYYHHYLNPKCITIEYLDPLGMLLHGLGGNTLATCPKFYNRICRRVEGPRLAYM